MSTKANPPSKPWKSITRKTGTFSGGQNSGYWFLFDKQLDKPFFMAREAVDQYPIAHLVTAGDSVEVEFDKKSPAKIVGMKLVMLAV